MGLTRLALGLTLLLILTFWRPTTALDSKCQPSKVSTRRACKTKLKTCPNLKWVSSTCGGSSRRVSASIKRQIKVTHGKQMRGCLTRHWCGHECPYSCNKDSECTWNKQTKVCHGKSRASAKQKHLAPFQFQFVFPQGATKQERNIMATAAKRWVSVIKTGFSTRAKVNVGETYCAYTLTADYTFEDLLVLVFVTSIDGPGGIYAQAGVCGLDDNNAPRLSVLRFDAADLPSLIASGDASMIALHELGHTLGIGSLWTYFNMTTPDPARPILYTFPGGIKGNEKIGGPSVGPVIEDTGNSGTYRRHWKETIYESELMTGYYGPGRAKMSLLTVGALSDLGFSVNNKRADKFQVPITSAPSPGLLMKSLNEHEKILNEEDPDYVIVRVKTVPK